MVSKKPKAKASSAWKKKYTKDVTKAATCRPHDGGGLPVPCSKIFPMDCPKDWSELCRALKQWGKCWETWGEKVFEELQNSNCGECNPQLILPPNPICGICEATKGMHAQWTLWADRVNALLKDCSGGGPNHVPPPPPPFN